MRILPFARSRVNGHDKAGGHPAVKELDRLLNEQISSLQSKRIFSPANDALVNLLGTVKVRIKEHLMRLSDREIPGVAQRYIKQLKAKGLV